MTVLTPSLDECQANTPPRPTATGEGVVPREYPSYPGSLSAETAVSYALEYERSYRHNEILANGADGADTIIVHAGVPDGYLFERRDGFLVGVTVSVDTEDNRTPPGGTAAPAGSDEFALWYLLTPSVGLRGPDLETKTLPTGPPDTVDLSGAIVVYCV